MDRNALRKRRLSKEEEAVLADYMSRNQEHEAIQNMAKASGDYDLTASALGQGKFRDTGRASEGYPEAIDSIIGAPARVGISELQDGNIKQALLKTMAQIGKDPKNAPTGVDIASKATSNPYLGTALATAVDFGAQLPVPMGIVGKVKDVAPEAQAILNKITKPEQAVALKGAEREQYLKALDTVYGDRAKRAKDMGFGGKTYYHGTGKTFDKFDPIGMAGKNTEVNFTKSGSYFTDNPRLASDYSSEKHGHNVLPVKINQKGGKAYYPEMSTFGDVEGALADEAFANGAKTVRFDDVQDPYLDLDAGPGQTVIVNDPSRIRSVNAAFDPRFKDSDLLLAGKAGALKSDPAILSAIRQRREKEKRK